MTKRRVVQLDLDYNYITTFRTMTEARKETNSNNIFACCKGIQHKSGGFRWIYEDDYLNKQKEVN